MMLHSVEQKVALILRKAGIASDECVLLSISGGRDSVVLAHILKNIGQVFALAHVNYHLRGVDSDADEAFVRNLADTWSVPCHVKHAEPGFAQGNLQQEARNLRYDWAHSLCVSEGYPVYICAHHQRDQVESFLMALLKGRGSKALMAMPVQKGRRLRPLLEIASNEIEAYAIDKQIAWRHDRSNDSSDYDRNYIRNILLPPVIERFPQAERLISRQIKRLQVQEAITDAWLQEHKSSWIEVKDSGFHRWNFSQLKDSSLLEWVIGRLASDYGLAQTAIDSLWQLWHASSGKKMKSGTWTIVRTRDGFDWFELPEKGTFELEIKEGCFNLPGGGDLKVEIRENHDLLASFCTPFLEEEPALKLRFWQNGDKVEVAGVGHKNVSDLMQTRQWDFRRRYFGIVLTRGMQPIWLVGTISRTFTSEQPMSKRWWVFTYEHD